MLAISQVGSVNTYNSGTGATTTGMTVTCPSGITAGDALFVAMDAAVNVSSPGSGWTNLEAQTSNVNSGLWYHVCDGTETGGTTSYGFTTGGTNSKWAGWILALRGVDTAQVVDNSGAAITTNNQTTTSTTATFNTITTVTDGCYIMLCGFARNSANNQTGNSWGAVSGYTELADTWSAQSSTGIVGNNGVLLDTATQATHGAVSSASSTVAKTSFYFNVTVAIKPGTPATVAGVVAGVTTAAPAGSVTAGTGTTVDPNTFTDSTATSEVGQGWAASGFGVTAARSSTQAHTGSFSTKVTSNPGGFVSVTAQTASGHFIAVTPGQTLSVAGWVYTDAASKTVIINVDLYQSDQTTYISTPAAGPFSVTQNAWTYVSASIVIPAGSAAYGIFYFAAPIGSTDNWYFDDPFVMPTSAGVTTGAPAGSVSVTTSTNVTITGAVSGVTTAASAGSVTGNASVAGPVGAVTIAAPAGSVLAVKNVTIAGAVSAVAIAAPAGGVSQTLPGAVSAVTVAAPAGSVSGTASVTGVVSAVTTTASAGSVAAVKNVTITGVVSAVTIGAPAGSVTTAGNATVAGVVAGVTTSAPAGGVSQTVTGVVSATTIAAAAGSVSGTATVAGAVSAVTVGAPAGSVTAIKNVTISGAVSTVTTGASAGTISTTVTISGAVAQITTGATPGSVDTAGNVSLPGQTSHITTAAPAGTVTATSSVTINGVVAGVTSAAPSGTVTAQFSVTITGVTAAVTTGASAGTIVIKFTTTGLTLRAQTIPVFSPSGSKPSGYNGSYIGIAKRRNVGTKLRPVDTGSKGSTVNNGGSQRRPHVSGTQAVPVSGG